MAECSSGHRKNSKTAISARWASSVGSFMGRILGNIGVMSKLLDAETVVVACSQP